MAPRPPDTPARRSRGPRPSSLELVLDGAPVTVLVRESPRSTRLRLTVRPGRAPELTVPRRTGRAALLRFLDDSSEWLADRLAEATGAGATPELGLEQPGFVRAAGEWLEVAAGTGRAAVAVRRGGRLHVSGPFNEWPAAIERWYRREARATLGRAVAREAPRLGVAPATIAVRDQRSRWGSCSSRGTLSFNWRLLLAPVDVLDYVVVHELLHLREANHSPAFWRLLDLDRPAWREQSAWLHRHGWELLAYRVGASCNPG